MSFPTTRWLVRFGYDGLGFYGWARQPGKRTVEGEVLDGLVRLGVSESAASARLAVASRTDRGVSARGNAVALSSALTGDVLLRALNGVAPEIFFSHAAEVPDGFRPRAADHRTYRYFEPGSGHDRGKWAGWARLFEGRIDVRSLGRGLPGSTPVLRDVTKVDVIETNGYLTIEIRGQSFVWGMVRKMVSALRALESGELRVADLVEALDGNRRIALPLAEPESLVLWDVSYPVSWGYRAERYSRRGQQYADLQRRGWHVRGPVLDSLWPSLES